MQCLARAVARSARTAAEGNVGRRFVATGSSAARSYINKQVRLATARSPYETEGVRRPKGIGCS